MSFFFIYKIGEQECGTGLPKGVGTNERERRWGRVWEGKYSANIGYTCM
jgi:hypothetical protein